MSVECCGLRVVGAVCGGGWCVRGGVCVGGRCGCVVCVCVACRGAENAAATSPAVAKGRLAASAPRSAIGGLRSGSRPSPCNPSRNAGSARPLAGTSLRSCARLLRNLRGFPPKASLSSAHQRRRHFPPGTFGQRGALMAFRRRTAGYRARIRRKARHPSATAARAAWSEYLPSRRASAFAASAASRRLRLLRLVSPPPRHASRWKALMVVREFIPCQGCAKRKSGSQ